MTTETDYRQRRIEAAAEAAWQEESLIAATKPRRIGWGEESEATRERWRRLVRAALAAADAVTREEEKGTVQGAGGYGIGGSINETRKP